MEFKHIFNASTYLGILNKGKFLSSFNEGIQLNSGP